MGRSISVSVKYGFPMEFRYHSSLARSRNSDRVTLLIIHRGCDFIFCWRFARTSASQQAFSVATKSVCVSWGTAVPISTQRKCALTNASANGSSFDDVFSEGFLYRTSIAQIDFFTH